MILGLDAAVARPGCPQRGSRNRAGTLLENCDDIAFPIATGRSAHYQIVVRSELSDRFAHAFLR
jgi:hypothetical protein